MLLSPFQLETWLIWTNYGEKFWKPAEALATGLPLSWRAVRSAALSACGCNGWERTSLSAPSDSALNSNTDEPLAGVKTHLTQRLLKFQCLKRSQGEQGGDSQIVAGSLQVEIYFQWGDFILDHKWWHQRTWIDRPFLGWTNEKVADFNFPMRMTVYSHVSLCATVSRKYWYFMLTNLA